MAFEGSGVICGECGEECGEVGLEAKAGAGGVGNGRWAGGSCGSVLDVDVDEFGLCMENGEFVGAVVEELEGRICYPSFVWMGNAHG
jgi:hypothetical protein